VKWKRACDAAERTFIRSLQMRRHAAIREPWACDAKRRLPQATAAARSLGKAMAFAIADHTGEMIATARMDGANPRILRHFDPQGLHRGADVPAYAQLQTRS